MDLVAKLPVPKFSPYYAVNFDYFLSQCIGDLQTIIEYSQFDSDPGPHNFTVVAVSTDEEQVEYEYHFNVSGKHKISLHWNVLPGKLLFCVYSNQMQAKNMIIP